MRLWTCRATLTAVVVADMPLDAVEQMRALVSAGDTGLDCSVSPTLGDVVALASALGIADWRELLGEVPPPRVPLDERD